MTGGKALGEPDGHHAATKVWRNGEIVAASHAVSADNRGFLVGESVFETLLAVDGAPAFLAAHIERLKRGAALFGISLGYSEQEIHGAINSLMHSISGRAVCRITLTQSGGARGLLAGDGATPILIVSVTPAPAAPKSLRIMISRHRRQAGAPTNIAKCAAAYGANILARREAATSGAEEAIMLNDAGRVASASAANVFLLDGRRLVTPPTGEGALPGVARAILLEEARAAGFTVAETPIEEEDLREGALLLTNSVIGVVQGAFDSAPPLNDAASALIRLYAARLQREIGDAGKGTQ